MYHQFCTRSSVDGHFGCFHALAFVYTAAVTSEQWGARIIMVFSHICPGVGLLADSFLVKPMQLIRQEARLDDYD